MEELDIIKNDIDKIKNIVKQIYNYLENDKLEKWEGIDDIEKCNIDDCENIFNLIECKNCCEKHCKDCKKNNEIKCCNCGFTSCMKIVDIKYRSNDYPVDNQWIHYGPKYLCWKCRDLKPTFIVT